MNSSSRDAPPLKLLDATCSSRPPLIALAAAVAGPHGALNTHCSRQSRRSSPGFGWGARAIEDPAAAGLPLTAGPGRSGVYGILIFGSIRLKNFPWSY